VPRLSCLSLFSNEYHSGPPHLLARSPHLLAPHPFSWQVQVLGLLTMKWLQILELAVLPVLVNAVASTDEYSDAVRTLLSYPSISRINCQLDSNFAGEQDIFQSGYLPSHNIDPAVVPTWTRTWKNAYNKNEKFYADPLVYTPSGTTRELVIVSSNQNVVRVIDGLTGKLVANKTLDAPFASVDSNCNDVEGTVGITGMLFYDRFFLLIPYPITPVLWITRLGNNQVSTPMSNWKFRNSCD